MENENLRSENSKLLEQKERISFEQQSLSRDNEKLARKLGDLNRQVKYRIRNKGVQIYIGIPLLYKFTLMYSTVKLCKVLMMIQPGRLVLCASINPISSFANHRIMASSPQNQLKYEENSPEASPYALTPYIPIHSVLPQESTIQSNTVYSISSDSFIASNHDTVRLFS